MPCKFDQALSATATPVFLSFSGTPVFLMAVLVLHYWQQVLCILAILQNILQGTPYINSTETHMTTVSELPRTHHLCIQESRQSGTFIEYISLYNNETHELHKGLKTCIQ